MALETLDSWVRNTVGIRSSMPWIILDSHAYHPAPLFHTQEICMAGIRLKTGLVS
jgi:hypothetical protein